MAKTLKKKAGSKIIFALLVICFLLLALSTSALAVPDLTYGDINNDGLINVIDVILVMQYILELSDLTDDQLKAADVNFDGEICVRDATLIMKYAIGLIDEFPEETKIVSVEKVTLEVAHGTKIEDIDFPATVQVTLQDDNVKNTGVEWDIDTASPQYNPNTAGIYEFEGDLVDLPLGVSNPAGITALAAVTVKQAAATPPAEQEDYEYKLDATYNKIAALEVGRFEGQISYKPNHNFSNYEIAIFYDDDELGKDNIASGGSFSVDFDLALIAEIFNEDYDLVIYNPDGNPVLEDIVQNY